MLALEDAETSQIGNPINQLGDINFQSLYKNQVDEKEMVSAKFSE